MNSLNKNVSTDNLSLRTGELLKKFNTKKTADSTPVSKSYEDVLAEISKKTEQRINHLKSSMSAEQLSKVNLQKKYAPSIISDNLQAKAYTGSEAAEKSSGSEAASTNNKNIIRYKQKIDELAVKRNVGEKFKNRDIDAELNTLISKKLSGANGESLSIRSDLPTVIKNYEVKPGDTLAAISKNFYKDAFLFKNISVVNEVKPPYKLSEGQNLRVAFHQVTAGEGDTLESMAEKYTGNQVSSKTLAKINDKSEISAGETILIPVQFTAAEKTAEANKTTETNKTAEADKAADPIRFEISKNLDGASIEETRRQIEKYASEIENLTF